MLTYSCCKLGAIVPEICSLSRVPCMMTVNKAVVWQIFLHADRTLWGWQGIPLSNCTPCHLASVYNPSTADILGMLSGNVSTISRDSRNPVVVHHSRAAHP
mmetsp:Transcript_12837/g.19324  ORF Transcript_12837/g.19324 Transcript_12837/m.19324 type:complete len:101 (+) Transcript_12837:130-432(+)